MAQAVITSGESSPVVAHEDAPAPLVLDPGTYRKRTVDGHGPAVAEEHPPRHRWEAVPRCDEPARFVYQRRDHPAVCEPRPALVALVEGEGRLVALRALGLGVRKVEADRVVAAPEASRVVVWRNSHALGTGSDPVFGAVRLREPTAGSDPVKKA